jgi:hypothetical protein
MYDRHRFRRPALQKLPTYIDGSNGSSCLSRYFLGLQLQDGVFLGRPSTPWQICPTQAISLDTNSYYGSAQLLSKHIVRHFAEQSQLFGRPWL